MTHFWICPKLPVYLAEQTLGLRTAKIAKISCFPLCKHAPKSFLDAHRVVMHRFVWIQFYKARP